MTFNRVFPFGHPEANGAESHIIKATEALAMQIPGSDWHHVQFHGDALAKLVALEGYAGIRIFPAHNGDHITLAIVAVDANGKPLVGDDIIAIENGERCPPLC